MRTVTYPLWLCLLCLFGCTAVSPTGQQVILTQTIHKTTASLPLTQLPAAVEIRRTADAKSPPSLPNTPFAMPPRSQTALRLIQQAEHNAKSLDSSQFAQTIVVETETFEQQIEQQCQIDFPDKMYCQTAVYLIMNGEKVTTSHTEVVQNGSRVWLRANKADEWQEVVRQAELSQTAVSSDDLLQPTTLSTFMQQPSFGGESRLAGEAMQKVAFGLDVAAYVEAMLPVETAVLFTRATADSSGHGTLWISQRDSLIEQAIITMAFQIANEPLTITTKANYFGFNDPVLIPNPAAKAAPNLRI